MIKIQIPFSSPLPNNDLQITGILINKPRCYFARDDDIGNGACMHFSDPPELTDSSRSMHNDGNGKKLVIIVHGAGGHKSYLYQEDLAKALPYSSFRFDVIGHGESSSIGSWGSANWINSIESVIAYFLKRNWRIFALIGHSFGVVTALSALVKNPFAFRHCILVSGRFNIYHGVRKFYMKKGLWDTLINEGSVTVSNAGGSVIK